MQSCNCIFISSSCNLNNKISVFSKLSNFTWCCTCWNYHIEKLILPLELTQSIQTVKIFMQYNINLICSHFCCVHLYVNKLTIDVSPSCSENRLEMLHFGNLANTMPPRGTPPIMANQKLMESSLRSTAVSRSKRINKK